MPSVFIIYLADKLNTVKMMPVTAMGEVQPDDIQAGLEHLPQDSVVAAGRT